MRKHTFGIYRYCRSESSEFKLVEEIAGKFEAVERANSLQHKAAREHRVATGTLSGTPSYWLKNEKTGKFFTSDGTRVA